MEATTSKITIGTIAKNFSYIAAAFLSLGPESYSILGLFMIVDTITGVVRSGVIHGWRSVTSHAATVGVLAKAVAIVLPILIAVLGHGVGIELTPLASSVLKILIFSEFYSIISNIYSIKQKKDVVEFDAINYILEYLRDFVEKAIKKPNLDV